ncbi:hypothetical protein RFI_15357 [Reticulomyxa filosa]|uniref:DUF924-domain-containing protein n=1 Tax=Reticulomyxa filosa TaxID=46433 RepID=X6N740_RETFI|nr:hypothetical protein RFI_15357 [Reticulomyxa filosa]|eukprot:ETO21846.1 hypothetical protein RFI_15357 [Reticulomyxa filosa]
MTQIEKSLSNVQIVKKKTRCLFYLHNLLQYWSPDYDVSVLETTESCDEYLEVLTYWFTIDPLMSNAKKKNKIEQQKVTLMMYGKNVDEHIKKEFEYLLVKGTKKELEHWKKDILGRLSLIILFDQFPRNMYRHSKQSYEYDPLALALCLDTLDPENPLLKQLKLLPTWFALQFYMPLIHSENLSNQLQSVQIYSEMYHNAIALHRDHPDKSYDTFLLTILLRMKKIALLHKDHISHFGRFPERNAILDRKSTPNEIAFLEAAQTSTSNLK